jgi:hypothetical protein
MRAPVNLTRRNFLQGLLGAAVLASSTLIATPDTDAPPNDTSGKTPQIIPRRMANRPSFFSLAAA